MPTTLRNPDTDDYSTIEAVMPGQTITWCSRFKYAEGFSYLNLTKKRRMSIKTCLVTGASRGFGAEIAKAGLVAGDKFIAAARIRATLPWFSETENVLALNMEVADDVEVSTW